MSDIQDAGTNPAEPEEPTTFDADYVKELRQEAAAKRTALKTAQQEKAALEAQIAELTKAQEASKQSALKEQGKYKELFEEASQKLASYEDTSKQVERLTGAVGKILETQLAGVPEHITTLLAKLDPVEQLEWLANYRDNLSKQDEPADARQRLNSFNPTGTNVDNISDAERIRKLQKATGINQGIFG